MKSLFGALVIAGLLGEMLTAGAGAEERTVVVPSDESPFAVQSNDLVRVFGKGIVGSRIEIEVKGPAKVEATSNVRQVKQGNVLLGNLLKEFDLKPTGKGKVLATITVKPPQPDAPARVTKYEFEVQ